MLTPTMPPPTMTTRAWDFMTRLLAYSLPRKRGRELIAPCIIARQSPAFKPATASVGNPPGRSVARTAAGRAAAGCGRVEALVGEERRLAQQSPEPAQRPVGHAAVTQLVLVEEVVGGDGRIDVRRQADEPGEEHVLGRAAELGAHLQHLADEPVGIMRRSLAGRAHERRASSVGQRTAVARQRAKARQAVRQMHPGHLLPDIDVRLRPDGAGIVESPGEDVDLVRPTLALVGKGRAAFAAVAADDAGRGRVAPRRLAAPGQLARREAG